MGEESRWRSRSTGLGLILSIMDVDPAIEDFQNFTHSVGAARLLMQRAYDARSLIEALVLYASVIDAFLRTLVAHATGDRQGNINHLDLRYFRHDETLWMNERKIYKLARDRGVLSQNEFDELELLYRFRNVVIHRFIISGIAYDEVGPKLDAYEVIYQRLYERLAAIEQPEPELSAAETDAMRSRIAKKLGEAPYR